MAVLAFASFTNPGGGYIQGYLGQEATLCADSYLYNVLDKQRKWYGENRRRNINCELYRNRALVVPAVRFDRNHVHAYADVIVDGDKGSLEETLAAVLQALIGCA